MSVHAMERPAVDVDVLALGSDALEGDYAARIAALDRLSSWCEATRLEYVVALEAEGRSSAPEESNTRTPHEHACLRRRATVTERVPEMLAALRRGVITASHLDHLAASLRRLEPALQSLMLADAARAVAVASSTHANEFGRWLRDEERRLGHSTGMATLEQQERAVRLRGRTDRASGMRVYTLSLDPVAALSFHQRVESATEALFHDRVPPTCPGDPLERSAFLNAHALLGLLDDRGPRVGKPEIIVVVDTTVNDGPPSVDWGLPVEIPTRVLHALWGRADVHAVFVRNGVVLYAPGVLDLGRTTRLANRAQRRALRAMYRRCAVPWCDVGFGRCKIHHVIWWRRGGRTDMCNLLPLCWRHHQLVHEGGWELTLGEQRVLRIREPSGRIRTTGPPKRAAA